MITKNNWYVITGGPSTGKTTVLAELQKLGHQIVPEAARTLIDEALAKGVPVETLRADEHRFQDDVARLKATVEAAQNTHTVTFFDRGMQDTLAYLRYYDFKTEPWLDALMQGAHYRKIFLLAPLPVFVEDYSRTENDDFPNQLHQLLYDAYREYGMEPVIVPPTSIGERVQFVLQNLD